jgi:hypothetical protein
MSDRYATVGRRDFRAAIEHLLETEFKLVGSHRVIRLIAEAIVELQREFYPERGQLEPGTIIWVTTKAGEGSKVSWGKRAEEYGTQLVHLPLVTKHEIETRMVAGPGRDPKDNRRKEFVRDMQTAVRLLKSAAAQGGLLSGAELSVLMNRSLGKVQQYIRTYEEETGEAVPLKGYVLDMGSSPTHKGIICRKYEEGMSPPDIARVTSHTLASVDNYLSVYDRIKVLLRKGLDVATVCQAVGKAPRTVAQYLVIIERFHPDLLDEKSREWLEGRRKRINARRQLPQEVLAPMLESFKKGRTQSKGEGNLEAPGSSGEAGPKSRTSRKTKRSSGKTRVSRKRKKVTGHMP